MIQMYGSTFITKEDLFKYSSLLSKGLENFVNVHSQEQSKSLQQLLLSTESAFATDYRDRYHVGSELWVADMFALRGGYKFFYDTEDWTVGMGLKLKLGLQNIMINVAYSNFDKYFEPPLRFSIGGSF